MLHHRVRDDAGDFLSRSGPIEGPAHQCRSSSQELPVGLVGPEINIKRAFHIVQPLQGDAGLHLTLQLGVVLLTGLQLLLVIHLQLLWWEQQGGRGIMQ